MIMFVEYGLNIQNPIPTKKLLEWLAVSKIENTNPSRKTTARTDQESDQITDYEQEHTASHIYQAIEHIEQGKPVLHAKQIMISPVIYLNDEMNISEALQLFKHHKYRHMPVITNSGTLAGIVSDRDIFHFTSELSQKHDQLPHNLIVAPISDIMSTPVLTANIETDVRYIARLFVMQHIGAMPVMAGGQIVGIITRTDIMRAVMQNFALELWI